jgi:hypothetical protein
LSFSRFRIAGYHLLGSAVAVGIIAFWIFFIWYPEPFRSLSGGLHLFGILVLVDLVLGPFATFIVSSSKKSPCELTTDIVFIVLLQFGAMAYGTWTIYQARPVYMAFEIDRFRTIHAIEIPLDLLPSAPVGFQSLPLLGPGLVAVRPFKNETERMDATLAALQGVHLGSRPDLWMPYEKALLQLLKEAKPVADLLLRKPNDSVAIVAAIESAGVSEAEIRYLPVVGRQDFWVVLIHKRTGQPLVYIPVDPY